MVVRIPSDVLVRSTAHDGVDGGGRVQADEGDTTTAEVAVWSQRIIVGQWLVIGVLTLALFIGYVHYVQQSNCTNARYAAVDKMISALVAGSADSRELAEYRHETSRRC